jgi:hypothetical protein
MNEFTDIELNALADVGEKFLKEAGLKRLLNDMPNSPPDFHPDTGWQSDNEWTKPPTE